ncbi:MULTISPECIES: helix-turn-helix transcriptional regulator [Vibrio]|nr:MULTISPECIES: AlpA family phage regulatory protein [Vibrio]
MTTLSRSAIYRGIRECRFPKQVRLSRRSVAWVESDIQNWIKAQVAERQSI